MVSRARLGDGVAPAPNLGAAGLVGAAAPEVKGLQQWHASFAVSSAPVYQATGATGRPSAYYTSSAIALCRGMPHSQLLTKHRAKVIAAPDGQQGTLGGAALLKLQAVTGAPTQHTIMGDPCRFMS